jgi:RNA polymerase sigma-70 factor (ECF subfamily)
VPVGTVRSRLHAGHRRLADALLATAAQAHPDRARARRYAEELGAAMTAFQRTGDTRALNDHLAVDVEYQLFDGVRRRDRARFAAALASEFDDGVRAEPLGVTAGAGLTVVDLRLHNPSDQPLHCPPALTQLFLHDGRTVRRITSHYATLQPDAARA